MGLGPKGQCKNDQSFNLRRCNIFKSSKRVRIDRECFEFFPEQDGSQRMAEGQQCPFVSRLNWRRPGESLHPSVHVLSLQQNAASAASNVTVGWLIGKNGAHEGEDFRLTQGEIMIGSGWDADVVLTSPDVSRTHAKITCHSNSCFIEDNGSASGTFVNELRCQQAQELIHGDIVKIGMGEFFYFALDVKEDNADEESKLLRTPDFLQQCFEQRNSTRGWLICESGELRGVDFRLMQGSNRVGSLPYLEVTIPDPNLISVHLSIECQKDRLYLRSKSADVRVWRQQSTVQAGILRDGDLIQLGALTLRLRSCL